jgi:membrane protein DedA with SNARE-associated domain
VTGVYFKHFFLFFFFFGVFVFLFSSSLTLIHPLLGDPLILLFSGFTSARALRVWCFISFIFF